MQATVLVPDHFCRLLQVNAREFRRPGKERLRRDGQAWSDDSAHVFAFGRYVVEGSGGAEVDHNAGAPEPRKGGDAVHQSIGAHFRRVVHLDRHSRLDTGFDEHRLDIEVALAHLAQGGVERRHHRGDNDGGDLSRINLAHGEEIQEQNPILVGSLGTQGADAPVRHQFVGTWLIDAKNRVGIADIEGEQHRSFSLEPGRRRSVRCGAHWQYAPAESRGNPNRR